MRLIAGEKNLTALGQIRCKKPCHSHVLFSPHKVFRRYLITVPGGRNPKNVTAIAKTIASAAACH
jgi:hypothetical protein